MNYRLLCSAVVLVGLVGRAQAGMIEICKDDSPAGIAERGSRLHHRRASRDRASPRGYMLSRD